MLIKFDDETHHVGLLKHLVRVLVGQGTWRRVMVYKWFYRATTLDNLVGTAVYKVNPTTPYTRICAAELTPQLVLRKLCHAKRTTADLELDWPRYQNDDKVIFLYNTPHTRFFH